MSQNPLFRRLGFTLIELLVVISIIALLLGILVPVLATAKKNANMMKEGTSLRNIHVAAMVYAGSNKDWAPGLLSSGKFQNSTSDFTGKYYAAKSNTSAAANGTGVSMGISNSYAEALLLEDASTNPAQWYSPGETNTGGAATALTKMQAATPSTDGAASTTTVNTDGYVTSSNNSYAVLAYAAPALTVEWKSTQNQQAVILGTRVMGGAAQGTLDDTFNTVWTDSSSGRFKGSIVRGDSSTSQENFSAADTGTTFGVLRYGATAANVKADKPSNNNGLVGVFASAQKVDATAGTDSATADTYDGSAGKFGAGVTSGTFVSGMIGSAAD